MAAAVRRVSRARGPRRPGRPAGSDLRVTR